MKSGILKVFQLKLSNSINICDLFCHQDCLGLHVRNIDILHAQGFDYAWYNQGVGNTALFFRNFKERKKAIDINCWHADIHNMDRLCAYKILNTNSGCERFQNDINISSYRKVRGLFPKFVDNA